VSTPLSEPPRDLIRLRRFGVEALIGVYGHEQTRPQRLELDLALHLDTRPAAGGDLRWTVDYGRLCGELRFLAQATRFGLLESLAELLAGYALLPRPTQLARVGEVVLELGKPDALGGEGIPSVQVRRRPEDLRVQREATPFGERLRLFDLAGCQVWRLELAQGGAVELEAELGPMASWMLVEGELTLGGAPLERGHGWRSALPASSMAHAAARAWLLGVAHRPPPVDAVAPSPRLERFHPQE
jgi:FolB domain-containing protein